MTLQRVINSVKLRATAPRGVNFHTPYAWWPQLLSNGSDGTNRLPMFMPDISCIAECGSEGQKAADRTKVCLADKAPIHLISTRAIPADSAGK